MKETPFLTSKEVALMSLQIGFSVAFSTVFFILGGRYLDHRFDTSPVFIILGGILGLAASLGLVWKIVQPLQQLKDK